MASRNFNHSAASRSKGRRFSRPATPSQREELFSALRDNDLERAETLLKNGIDPDTRDPEGNTAFHHAVRNDNPAALDLLASFGADPNLQNKDRFTPFLEALWQGRPMQVLEGLIRNGAFPSAGSLDRKNAFHIAVKRNAVDLVPFLVKNGVDINGRDEDGQTPLHYALVPVRPDMVKVLMKHGADPTIADKRGENGIFKAVEQGDLATLKELMKHPLSINCINAAQTFESSSTPLIAAVRDKNIKTVRFLLDMGALPNQPDLMHRTPLYHAFDLGLLDISRLLIKRGADPVKCPPEKTEKRHLVHMAAKESRGELLSILTRFGTDYNIKDGEECNAIHYAIAGPSLENLEKLLDAGVNPDEPDRFGRRPIDLLIHRYGKECAKAVEMLLEKGANPNIPADHRTVCAPLHIAARQNNVAMIDALIKAGADLEVKDRIDGATPLVDAARYTCPDALSRLIAGGANIHTTDSAGQTPLHVAAYSGNADSAEVLIKAGSSIEKRNGEKQTPLMIALKRGYPKVARLLIKGGADVRVTDELGGNIFHMAAQDNDNMDAFSDLVKAAPAMNINARDSKGETPLLRAVRTSREYAARGLIKAGARVNIANNDGQTPLMVAIENGQQAIVADILRLHPAEAKRPFKDGQTALHIASGYYSTVMARHLLDAGANIAAKDKDGNTPLHIAVTKGQRAMVEFLLNHDADLAALNNQGESPLSLAEKNNQNGIAELLEEETKQRNPPTQKPPQGPRRGGRDNII